MGNICDCLNGPKEYVVDIPSANVAASDKYKTTSGPTQKTPLLAGGNPVTTAPGRSARQHDPVPKKEDFMTSLECVTTVELGEVATLPSLDKTFQDHAKLYNDLHSSFKELRDCLHAFKAHFEYDTRGIPVLGECLRILNTRCGTVRLRGSRTKNCIQIIYNQRSVSNECQGTPEDVIDTLELYNTCNKHIKSVLDKAPKVKSSISLILEEEHNLKKEVTKADPDGRQGVTPLKVTSANFQKLHKLPSVIDTIHKYTTDIFKEISNGSKILFDDEIGALPDS